MKQSQYETACGLTFTAEGRRRTYPLIIAQSFYAGEPPADFKDWERKECSGCHEKRHKTKHQWVPKGATSLRKLYMTADTYCLAERKEESR